MGLVVLWATSALVYLGIAMAPGDEVTARLGPEVAATLSPADLQQMRINLGLNRPLPIRYAIWIGKVVHGDLGHSSTTDSTVIEALKTRIGATAMLIFFALFVGVVVGIFFGILAAVKENTWIDYLVGSVPILFIGIPSFIISLTAIYLVILPGSVLAISLAAPIIRYTRASMLDVLNSEFIVAARSKGLREGKVIVTHAFRNALIPIISIVGMFFPEVIAGAVITETIFRWPGMGQLAAKAASARDVTTVMGVVLAVATSVVIANLITDIAYTVADPRVRLG
jgi:peptide/nickel transport system permease protein